MRLSCVGLLRYKLFIKTYVAALDLGERAASGDVLADVPKRLELSYFWSIRGSDFGKAGDQILAQNVDAKTFAALRPRLDRINACTVTSNRDRYSLTYVPGVGTELALIGSPLGVIDGADFGAAYLRIWLGDHSIDVRLRDQLLECARQDVEGVRAALPACSASRRRSPTKEQAMSTAARLAIDWVERDYIPDAVIRRGMLWTAATRVRTRPTSRQGG